MDLAELAKHMEEHNTGFTEAMCQGMMTAVIVILLVKVLPVFRQVFRQLGLEISGISGALLGIGETLSHYSTAFLVLLAAMIGFIHFLPFGSMA